MLQRKQKKELSEEEIKDIQEALEEVKQGKTKPIENIAKELGISLT